MNIKKSQRGAVLAFSLVMLLLLTLAATRMIQLNKQQLEMANNARLMTQEFANAEGVLAEAENLVETDIAHHDPTTSPAPAIFDDNHQCTPIDTVFKQQLLLAGTVLVNKTLTDGTTLKAEITETSCGDKNGALIKTCTSYNHTTGVITCNVGGTSENCTGKTINEIAALFPDGDACYQHYDPMCLDDAYYTVHGECSIKPPRCPVETYKIRAVSTSANGGERELIRGKQIKCGTP